MPTIFPEPTYLNTSTVGARNHATGGGGAGGANRRNAGVVDRALSPTQEGSSELASIDTDIEDSGNTVAKELLEELE